MNSKDLGTGAGVPCCYHSTQSCRSSSTLTSHCGVIPKANHTAQCLAQQISYSQPRGSPHDASTLHPTSYRLKPSSRVNLEYLSALSFPSQCTAHLQTHSQGSSVMQALRSAHTGIPPHWACFLTLLLPLIFSQPFQ